MWYYKVSTLSVYTTTTFLVAISVRSTMSTALEVTKTGIRCCVAYNVLSNANYSTIVWAHGNIIHTHTFLSQLVWLCMIYSFTIFPEPCTITCHIYICLIPIFFPGNGTVGHMHMYSELLVHVNGVSSRILWARDFDTLVHKELACWIWAS